MPNDVGMEDASKLAADLEALAEAGQPLRGPACTVKRILDRLPDQERETLNRVLANEQVSAAAIARTLQANGHSIGHNAVNRHRRGYAHGGCACEIR